MSPYKNVVVLGATGNVGRPLIAALASTSTFTITAASRSNPTSNTTYPTGVTPAIVDYTSPSSLLSLFTNQDVVIEAFNPAAAALQGAIVDAAIEAGVKHIITPDFACDTFCEHAGDLRIYDPKIEAQRQLEERLKRGKTELKWTAVITGGWYDWAIPIGWFWIQPRTKTIYKYGSGNQRWSVSRVATAGMAVVEVLNNPEKYENRPVYVADHTVSTNEVIPMLKEIDPEWQAQPMEIDNLMEQAKAMWDEDTKNGVTNRLATQAYALLGTAGLFDENNKYMADMSSKLEMGFERPSSEFKEELRELVAAKPTKETEHLSR